MSKQFTIITKDGSKWLRPSLGTATHIISPDLPYIGYRPEGTSLSEEQVKPRRQVLYNGVWQQFKRPIPNGNYETRIAYTDAESHDRHISDDYPGVDYQPLFNHMSKQYGLTLTTGEMDEIIGLSTYILAKK